MMAVVGTDASVAVHVSVGVGVIEGETKTGVSVMVADGVTGIGVQVGDGYGVFVDDGVGDGMTKRVGSGASSRWVGVCWQAPIIQSMIKSKSGLIVPVARC